jgi:predicted metal-dependent phosphotriesterase family hydrolase
MSTDEAAVTVITVLGPLSANELGVTDSHDHLALSSPALAGQEFDDADKAVEEVLDAKSTGIASIVELTPIGLGRDPALLRHVAQTTGVHVIGATGFHRDEHYKAGHWVYDASTDELRDRMVADIERGMHPHDWNDPAEPLDSARAGVIKMGASYQHVSKQEQRRLTAAAQAARQTGVAIVCHTEIGTAGDEIIDVVEAAGLPANRLVLAHPDRNPDPEVHAELAERGVYLEYDTAGRIKYRPDSDLLRLISEVLGAGFGDRILLGLDMGRRDYFRAYGGGPGMRYLMAKFVPRLEKRIGAEAVRRILVDNPARAFALTPQQ